MLNGLFILGKSDFRRIYGSKQVQQIKSLVNIYAEPLTAEQIAQNPSILSDMQLLFSGWNPPLLNKAFLDLTPKLEAVFYGAGTIAPMVSDDFWAKEIPITSAAAANAVPVAEYTVSQIIFSMKLGWQVALDIKQQKKWPELTWRRNITGNFGSTVGLVSLGLIGRKVCELLKNYDINVLAYDPFTTDEQAKELGVELVSLDEIFSRADVVSLHSPLIPETTGMITGNHLQQMKPNSTFINTARGMVVKQNELIEVMRNRKDMIAILDVLEEEPPEYNNEIFSLPNIICTPHISGSQNTECQRLGNYMVEELNRYLSGKPLKWQVSSKKATTLSIK